MGGVLFEQVTKESPRLAAHAQRHDKQDAPHARADEASSLERTFQPLPELE